MFWENEVETIDEGDGYIVHSFVIQDVPFAEFASRTFSQIVNAFARLKGTPVDWRSIVHKAGHLAHDSGRLRALVTEGASYGVITNICNFSPHTAPPFL